MFVDPYDRSFKQAVNHLQTLDEKRSIERNHYACPKWSWFYVLGELLMQNIFTNNKDTREM